VSADDLLLFCLDLTDRHWAVGDAIHHPTLGIGELLSGREGYLRAKFSTAEATFTDHDELQLIPDAAEGNWSLVSFAEATSWRDEFIKARELAKTEGLRRERLKVRIKSLLEDGDVEQADRLYRDSCQGWWATTEFDAIRNRANFVKEFVSVYRRSNLSELDAWFEAQTEKYGLTVHEFVTLKVSKVDRILKSMKVTLDDEQLRANAYPENRLLITARAGSGKTRTLCAKAALSIQDEGLYPDQVLILAFNKAAAATVKKRLEAGGQVKDYRNARTFHSLAYQLVKPRKKLLFDAGGEPSAREQSRFAQRMLHRIMNPAFKESMVEFFRQELEQVEGFGRDLAPNDYAIFRRSLEHVSLKGERVKSSGEKIIADFLFEHGIDYRYEKVWAWKVDFLDGSVYRPDFSIVQGGHDYVLEHWAIDPDDPRAAVPERWMVTTRSYRNQITAKRAFWLSRSMELLETHAALLLSGREAFEHHLRGVLDSQGIKCQRLSREEIVKRVFENDFAISRMAELFLQFIQRSKKKGWSADQVFQVTSATPDPEPRARLFHNLALRAYREYEAMLAEESSMDFDDLLAQATQEVMDRGDGLKMHLGEGKMLALSELRWIMLDEYQDFSELYFRMLEAILKVNPRIRLIAVGDDWQAINAFAGAELRFFYEFGSYFPKSSSTGVATNYRSDSLVVTAGNKLMAGRGMPAEQSRTSSGVIQVLNTKDVWIEFREGNAFKKERDADAIFLPARKDGQGPTESMQKLAQALKLCVQKIQGLNWLASPPERAMVLARTGNVYGVELAEFRRMLVHALAKTVNIPAEGLEPHISALTAHGAKGQEAHTVFILDATHRQFPKVHPDNLLFRPFGVTPMTVLDEERRLFYVAMTRAEHRLFALTESGEESPYLYALDPNVPGGVHPRAKQPSKPQGLGELASRIEAQIAATPVSMKEARS